MIYLCLIILMTLLGSAAALFLKKASSSNRIGRLIKNGSLYAGGGLYVIAAFINIYVLRYLDYSTVLPLTSLTYVWTMILSRYILRENITVRKIIGAAGIVTGAIFIAV